MQHQILEVKTSHNTTINKISGGFTSNASGTSCIMFSNTPGFASSKPSFLNSLLEWFLAALIATLGLAVFFCIAIVEVALALLSELEKELVNIAQSQSADLAFIFWAGTLFLLCIGTKYHAEFKNLKAKLQAKTQELEDLTQKAEWETLAYEAILKRYRARLIDRRSKVSSEECAPQPLMSNPAHTFE